MRWGHVLGHAVRPPGQFKKVASHSERAYPGARIIVSTTDAFWRPRGLPDMKILPPVSIEARRLLPSRWDLLAAALVLGFLIAFADASRFLVQPLSSVSGNY